MKTLSGADLEWFWTELAHAARVAQPLPDVLREMAAANPGTRCGKTAGRIAAAVSSGKALSKAVAEDGAFPLGAAEAVESGERAGKLEAVLGSLAESVRNESSLRLGIIQAVAYPLLVTLVALVAVIFLQVHVLPMFAQMYEELDIDLPSLTIFVLAGYGAIAFAVAAAPVLLLMALYLIPPRLVPLRSVFDWLRVRVPMLGEVLRLFLLARWCGMMGTLVSAGVPEPQAVRMAGRSTGHAGFEARSRRVAEDVETGLPLGVAMAESRQFFPPPLVWMVNSSQSIGGHSGIWPVAQDLYRARGERLSVVASIILRVAFIVMAFLLVAMTVMSLFVPMIRLGGGLGG